MNLGELSRQENDFLGPLPLQRRYAVRIDVPEASGTFIRILKHLENSILAPIEIFTNRQIHSFRSQVFLKAQIGSLGLVIHAEFRGFQDISEEKITSKDSFSNTDLFSFGSARNPVKSATKNGYTKISAFKTDVQSLELQ